MQNLNEQQRLLLAVVLSLGILLAWGVLFPNQDAEESNTVAVERVEEPAKEADVRRPQNNPRSSESIASPVVADETEHSQPEDVPPPEQKREFETPGFRGVLSNRHAQIEHLELKNYIEKTVASDNQRLPVDLVAKDDSGRGHQASVDLDFGAVVVPALDFFGPGLALRGKNEALEVDLTVVADEYTLRYGLRVRNRSQQTLNGLARVRLNLRQSGSGRSMFAPAADVVSGLCYYGGGVDRDLVSSLSDEPVRSADGVQWVGIDRQYFVIAAVPLNVSDGKTRCSMSAENKTAHVTLELPAEQLEPGSEWQRDWVVFAGPKRIDVLDAVGPTLGEAIEYNLWGIPLGAIARPMVFLLNLFHGWVGNWGFAIIALTFMVKLALFPITYRSARSMKKMQDLRPQIEKIKAQFADDKERQQMEQMKLMRESGVNPLGGCLPLILQMPIWFALYRTLWTSVDLYQQPFLWISDLTAAEPFPVLALVVGGMTFLQQRLQPQALDNPQMKVMMYMMPVMFTFFMFALPSGLVLYILVNSGLTILQQLVINRQR